MSFGFGIGDFVTVIELANRLRKEFLAAPEQYEAITKDIENFSLIIQNVSIYFENHGLTDAERNESSGILLNCKQTLLEADKALSKRSSLKSEGHTKSVKGHTKRFWHRVKFEPEDIKDIRGRITANATLLSAYLDGLERKTLASLVAKQDGLIDKQQVVIRRQYQQENQELLDWLAPSDYIAQHSNFASHRLVHSGQWLLESSDYQEWSNIACGSDCLFLEGIPGAGKTVLSSVVIDELEARYGCTDNIGTCYYYCDYSREVDQDLEQILRRFLRQLADPTALSIVKDLYDDSKSGKRLSLSVIKSGLRATIRHLACTFIVIDALDECQLINGCRKALLMELLELKALPNANVKLLATSRPLQDIALFFKCFKTMEVRASDQDIGQYVMNQFQYLPSFVAQQPSLQEEIKTAIIRAVDGIFLLAVLHTKALKGKRSPRQLRLTLGALGSLDYAEAYNTTMSRICGQVEDQKNLAIDTLTWIVYAKRSLTTKELLHALATEIGSPEFYEDGMPTIEDVLSSCCGLVVVESQTHFVRLVHRTTKDFFTEHGLRWLPQPHTKLSKVCDTYLAFDALAPIKDNPGITVESLIAQYSLYDYASWHFSDHAESREALPTVKEFVANQISIDKSSEALKAHSIPDYWSHWREHPDLTGLHLLAYCGLTTIMPEFLERYDVNEVDKLGRTPISCAFQGGQEQAMKILIEKGARLEDQYIIKGRDLILSTAKSYSATLLFHAIYDGKLDALALLLKGGADIDYFDNLGQTPLYLAAFLDVYKIKGIDLLLDNGANIRTRNADGRTPLHAAISRDRPDNLRLLIDRGGDLLAADSKGITPLHEACSRGGNECALILLQYGASAEALDNSSCSRSDDSTHHGCTGAFLPRLLDAMLCVADIKGDTPLHKASQRYSEHTALLLLDHGACLSTKNIQGENPVMLAARHDMFETTKALFAHSKDDILDDTDNQGRTLSHFAARRGNIELLELILFVCAPDTLDKFGRNILDYAAMSGSTEMARKYYGSWKMKGVQSFRLHLGLLCIGHVEMARGRCSTF